MGHPPLPPDIVDPTQAEGRLEWGTRSIVSSEKAKAPTLMKVGADVLGWVEGFEPSTAGATDRSSTTELYPPCPTSSIAKRRSAADVARRRRKSIRIHVALRKAPRGSGRCA